MEVPDHSQLRVSDTDRHRVAEVLRDAAGEGRIDLDELDERLEATYAAKTYADLVPITVDLPMKEVVAAPKAQPARHVGPVDPSLSHATSVAIMGDNKRVGAWLVPERHTAFSMMGSVTLDLRRAQFERREVTITAVAIMGDVKVVVDQFTRVVVDGVGIMGDFSEAREKVPAQLSADSPVVRVKGTALMAAVSVQRRGEPTKAIRDRFRG